METIVQTLNNLRLIIVNIAVSGSNMKKTLYIIFLIPLTFLALAGPRVAIVTFELAKDEYTVGITAEDIEQRIEDSGCTLQEKEDYRKGICPTDAQGEIYENGEWVGGDAECCVSRAILSMHRGSAGAVVLLGLVVLIASIFSVVYIPFFLFYVFKIRKRVFKK